MTQLPEAFRQHPDLPDSSAVDEYIGARIRGRRSMLQISQEGLAGRLGLPVAVIIAFEEGMVRIKAGTLHDISSILRVPIRFFFNGYAPVSHNDEVVR